MTAPMSYPTFNTDMRQHFDRLRARFASRHNSMAMIAEVRAGNITQLFPEELQFSLTFHGSPIANFVDIVARDMAEGIAPLPSLACVSGRMETQADQERAERKNRIGDQYHRESRLEIQMMTGADQYVSYGFVPFFVEMDQDCKLPYIHIEDPRDSWYELDRYGRVRVYAHRFRKSIDELTSMFPGILASLIRDGRDSNGTKQTGDTILEMIRWVEGDTVTYFLPERKGLQLLTYKHGCKSGVPVVIAERPGVSATPRGQFDDVIYVQIARSIMSTFALEGAQRAVQAPIAIPEDVDNLNIGPHAVMQSKDADKIRVLDLSLPTNVFAEGQVLDQELRTGARYPEARSGTPGTSVITGKGVEALLGSFDSQIKGAQLVFKEALQRVTAICFEMDEAWYPDVAKTVSGTISGASYEFSYTPAKDIAGKYQCTVTYGFAAGLAPSQSIITMLQLEGAGLIAKGTTMENLPFSIDQIQEMRKINVESSRDALKQGVFAYIQSAGQMAAQGADPMPVIQLGVDMVRGIQNGVPVEEAIASAFQSMQQAQQAAAQAAQAQQQAAQPGGAPDPGAPPDTGGSVQGVAPGQAGMPPGGRPALEQMISGMRGDGSVPVLQNEIRRSVPLGTQ